MARLPVNEVRWLSIEEIADLWARERKERPSLISRELQLALINWERAKRGEERITEIPSESERPPLATEISRDQLEEFCAKQKWRMPRFWFGVSTEPHRRGRPSKKDDILRELNRIAVAGELKPSISGQARQLAGWLAEQDPDGAIRPESIENIIRDKFRILKMGR